MQESLRLLSITRVVLAQRLGTIRDVDRIYMLDAGRIVEHGTHNNPSGAMRSCRRPLVANLSKGSAPT